MKFGRGSRRAEWGAQQVLSLKGDVKTGQSCQKWPFKGWKFMKGISQMEMFIHENLMNIYKN